MTKKTLWQQDNRALSGNVIIADVFSTMTGDLRSPKANTARIVASWNACEGIPTAQLEAGIVGDLVEALEAITVWKEAIEMLAPELGSTLKAIYRAEAILSRIEGDG